MMYDKDDKKIFISFYDEHDVKRTGFFILIEKTINYVSIKTNSGNIITIPYHRILKIKENRGDSDDN